MRKKTLAKLEGEDLILAPGAVMLIGAGEYDTVWIEVADRINAAPDDIPKVRKQLDGRGWRTQVLETDDGTVVVGRLRVLDDLEAIESDFEMEHAIEGLMDQLWTHVLPSFKVWWDDAVDHEVLRLARDGALDAPNNVRKPISAKRADELRGLLDADNILEDRRGDLSLGGAMLRTLQLGGPGSVELTINSAKGFGASRGWKLALQRKDREGERKTDVFVWIRPLQEV